MILVLQLEHLEERQGRVLNSQSGQNQIIILNIFMIIEPPVSSLSLFKEVHDNSYPP